ncbi:MAG: replication initiation protein [Oscillospiraceae bacterium]|nr:replication initiation protein [Oscillospiraceae bacterium]
MPRRKKLPPIPDYEGTGKTPEKAYIQKARPLQSLSETDLTLPELKILDAYLARINSHNPDKRTVKLEKGELERYLGVSRILKDDLNKRLRHLFQVIEVKDENKRKGFKLINLFEEADAEQDENGLWQVTLTCTPSAREYVFNIDNIGYLRYRLKNVINLTSRYSYVLFLYLVDNRFRKSWKIDLSDLKTLLNCTAETYSQYKRFNDLILKKCHKEINEKTDLRFSFTPVKKGRKVAEIEFTVETIADEIPSELPEQLSFEELEEEIDYGGDLANLLGSAACKDEFSPEQVRMLQDLVLQAVPSRDHIAMCDYLAQMVHKMNYYNPKKDRRFAYLCQMIQSEIKKG